MSKSIKRKTSHSYHSSGRRVSDMDNSFTTVILSQGGGKEKMKFMDCVCSNIILRENQGHESRMRKDELL